MTRSTDLAEGVAPPPTTGGAKTKKHVCPYCGAVTAVIEKPTGPCPKCNMEDTPATRAATKARIGPWYVLQTRNPSAPGMKWATLLSLVSKGQVTPRSVVRGPTTHQLWKFAAHVKGLSREFNLCYSCGGEIERTTNQCQHCDRLQEPPVNPDSLLESRDLTPRGTLHKEIKLAQSDAPTTDMVLAGGSDDRRQRNPDDGILSAKELAAAFQLDFNPGAAPATPAAAVPRAKRRRPVRALVTLILLAAIGGGAVLYAKPDYRAKTMTWVNGAIATVKNTMSQSGKPPAQPLPWEAQQAKKTVEVNDAGPAPIPAAADVAPAPAPEPVVDKNVTPPAPEPEPTPVAVAEKPIPSPMPSPPPAPEPVKPVEVAVPTHKLSIQEKLQRDLDAPIPTDLDEQATLYKRLYDGAIDAEVIPDYTLSIRCYQKIKQLDPSVRNDGVIDYRLKYAKEQLPK